mgnify:CR=1 FL=1
MISFAAIKSAWRPVFGWVFILFFAVLGLSLIAMLWLRWITLEQASSILVTMLGMGGVVTGTYVAGRSVEKYQNKSKSEYEVHVPTGVADPNDGLGD